MNVIRRWTEPAEAAATRHFLTPWERALAEHKAIAIVNGQPIVTVNDVLLVVENRPLRAEAA